MRRAPVVLAAVLALVGCGPDPESSGAGSASAGGEGGTRVQGRGTAEEPYLLCHMNGGPDRTDYPFVAEYRCEDGSVPLGGDPRAGAQARVDNVGEGPDGHIVDLYRVPCQPTPVDVYVDAYHCGPLVDTEVDPAALTDVQLANLAVTIRGLHQDPFSSRAIRLRQEAYTWLQSTPQVSVELCPPLVAMLPGEDASYPFAVEFALSLAAALIEDGGYPADPLATQIAGLAGVLLYYQSILEAGGEPDPQMDALLEGAQTGELDEAVHRAVGQCDLGQAGVRR